MDTICEVCEENIAVKRIRSPQGKFTADICARCADEAVRDWWVSPSSIEELNTTSKENQ